MTNIERALEEYEEGRIQWIFGTGAAPRPYVREVMLKHGCVMVALARRAYGGESYYDFLRARFKEDQVGWFIASGGVWFSTQAEADFFSFYCETKP